MCRGKNHGGRRCPHDTSDKRRYRRKAAKLRVKALESKKELAKRASLPQRLMLPDGYVPTIEELTVEAAQLRELANSEPPVGVTQENFDSMLEEQTTLHGLKIAKLVELDANINFNKISEQVEELEEEMYAEVMVLTDETFDAREEALQELKKVLTPETKLLLGDGWTYESIDPHRKSLTSQMTVEEQEAFLKTDQADNNFFEAQLEFNQVEERFDEKVNKIYETVQRDLKTGYVKVLDEIRGLGGEIKVEQTDGADVTPLLERTVGSHYPTEWLVQNNNYVHPLKVETTTSRGEQASFISGLHVSEHDGVVKPEETNVTFMATENLATAAKELFPEQNFTVYELEQPSGSKMFGVNKNCADEELYDPEKHGERKKGQGWEYRRTIKSFTLPGLKHKTDNEIVKEWGRKRWVKPLTTTLKQEHKMIIHPDGSGGVNDAGEFFEADSVVYHEFGHRMEKVNPKLVKAEKAFLKRRTGKTDENFYTSLKTTGFSGGVGHNGGFVESYTGREYFHDEHYEVFTTGVEAIYGNSYGGLVGLNKFYDKADNDHRGFVLGALSIL